MDCCWFGCVGIGEGEGLIWKVLFVNFFVIFVDRFLGNCGDFWLKLNLDLWLCRSENWLRDGNFDDSLFLFLIIGFVLSVVKGLLFVILGDVIVVVVGVLGWVVGIWFCFMCLILGMVCCFWVVFGENMVLIRGGDVIFCCSDEFCLCWWGFFCDFFE